MVVDQIESSMRHKMAEGSQRLPSDGGLSSKESKLNSRIYILSIIFDKFLFSLSSSL